MENRIVAAALAGGTVSSIATAVKTKRYALTRVYRVLFHIILSIRHSELNYYAATGFARYARVLGFRKESANLLNKICDNSKIPVLVNLKKDIARLDNSARVMFEKELQATAIYYAPLKHSIQISHELSTLLII